MNRRELLQVAGSTALVSLLPQVPGARQPYNKSAGFIPCLNMATIRGHKLGFVKELETASKAGFGAVEIWIDSFETYLQKGGTVQQARAILKDLGIEVVNCIGFAEWIVDDEERRKKGLTQLAKEMELLAAIGCKRVAAPPAGAVQEGGLSLYKAAERYRAILELGEKTGVVPHLELWGFSKNLSRLSEVLFVATESCHTSAKVLLDVYHLFKGGSGIATLPLVSAAAAEILHVNDYTADMQPATISDADRIFPGLGVAPVEAIISHLKGPQKPLIISVEVFNKTYYTQDALQVAKKAMAQIKKVTASAN